MMPLSSLVTAKLTYFTGYEGRFCERRPFCRVYITDQNKKCGFQSLSKHLQNISEECNSNAAIFTGSSLPTELKFEAVYTSDKSFMFEYKYIECTEAAIPISLTTQSIGEGNNATESTRAPTSQTSNKAESYMVVSNYSAN